MCNDRLPTAQMRLGGNAWALVRDGRCFCAGHPEGDGSTAVARLLAQLPFGALLLGIMRGMRPESSCLVQSPRHGLHLSVHCWTAVILPAPFLGHYMYNNPAHCI